MRYSKTIRKEVLVITQSSTPEFRRKIVCLHEDEGQTYQSIDAKLIDQVMVNLTDNAIKYTPAGSVIEIHTGQEGNGSRFRWQKTALESPTIKSF